MTPGAHVLAAIDILDTVFAGMSAEPALTRWARGARYAGSKDRAAVRDYVFQALRCRRSYAALGGGSDGRATMIGALRADDKDVDGFFTGEGYAPMPLSASEKASNRRDLTEAETSDLPDWLWSVFVEDLGEHAGATAKRQTARAPIALRVNANMCSVAQAIEKLSEDGVEAKAVDVCETALIVTSGERKIRTSAAYQSGAVELQDASSQAAMSRVSISDGAQVLDYCAGGGGKTLALAASGPAQENGVAFFAYDEDPGRMADLPARAERAGIDVTRLAKSDLATIPRFDIVLCDVPCSGSGTWRRSPDAKWRLEPADLSKVIEIQRDIIRDASRLVRSGGQLIYTTCSVLTRENEAQIAWVQEEMPEFSIRDQYRWDVNDEGDGFFFAALVRKS